MADEESVCQEAHRLVMGVTPDGSVGGRQGDYGHPAFAFTVVAEFWTSLLQAKGKLNPQATILAEDVVQCLQLLKIQREAYKPKRDNRVDLAGYAQVLDLIMTYDPFDAHE